MAMPLGPNKEEDGRMTSLQIARFRLQVALRTAILSVAICASVGLLQGASAQPYPTKPIRVVVPYPPGGAGDTVARAIGQKLGEFFGQPVIVDNRPGAQTVIGADIVSRSAPDGYTLLLTFNAHHILPFFSKNVPFDSVRDFTPVVVVARAPNVVAVHPSLPVTSMRELVEYARKNPGKLNYATPGAGTSDHLAGELLRIIAKIDLVHVPYKGGSPALNDLLGGQIQMGILVISTVLPHARSGKVRALGVIEDTRAKAAPEIPTIAEAGIAGYAVPDTWVGFLGPAGLPSSIVSRFHEAVTKTIAVAEVRSRLEASGFEVAPKTPEEFAVAIARSVQVYRKITTDAGIRPE